MIKDFLLTIAKSIKKPAMLIGVTGFSTTVAACYGPPPAPPESELNAASERMLIQCVDGTKTDKDCQYGCKNSTCLQKFGNAGDPCDANLYVETCVNDAQSEQTANTKRACVDGHIAEVPCPNCTNNQDQISCQTSE
ncbi:MAG: hypothetical protein IJM59_01745 [Proteobacteria bacterium]|nr:hypothetical protein [Pseudomonadota bacterium]